MTSFVVQATYFSDVVYFEVFLGFTKYIWGKYSKFWIKHFLNKLAKPKRFTNNLHDVKNKNLFAELTHFKLLRNVQR